MIKIKGKIFKVGNSYGVRIKKALVDAEIFTEGQEVELTPVETKAKNSGSQMRTSDVVIPIIAEV